MHTETRWPGPTVLHSSHEARARVYGRLAGPTARRQPIAEGSAAIACGDKRKRHEEVKERRIVPTLAGIEQLTLLLRGAASLFSSYVFAVRGHNKHPFLAPIIYRPGRAGNIGRPSRGRPDHFPSAPASVIPHPRDLDHVQGEAPPLGLRGLIRSPRRHGRAAFTEFELRQLDAVRKDLARTKHLGSPYLKLRLPLRDLIGVDVELLRKLSQGSFALDGGKRHLRLKSRCVVPARSSAHCLS